MSKQKLSVREAALHILDQIDKNQSYSNLLVNHVIQSNHIKGPDVGLLTELTYGTIQRKMTLDYYLEPFLKKKTEGWVQNLLRVSLYQMLYLDRVPERAAIHEAVEIAKKRGHKGISGMVNGVLRSVQRQGVRELDAIADPVERLAIETSHPVWLVRRWVEQFGEERTGEMCRHNLIAPVQTARVNTVRMTADEAVARLADEGTEVEKSPVVPDSIRFLKGNVAHTTLYKEGSLSVQDESSMLVAYALDPQPGETVLDMCAAPGGKTTHIAERMDDQGRVVALDLHAHKVKLIAENAGRLHLSSIEGHALDARKASESFQPESFDRILVDAPCSGLGVVRRKPDIKYAKNEQDLGTLQRIQLEILDTAVKMLKPGGILIYSTCTVDSVENHGTVHAFLEQHSTMSTAPLDGLPEAVRSLAENDLLQVFPQDFGGDGFFIARFVKAEG